MFCRYKNYQPIVDKGAFVAVSANVIGAVTIGSKSSVWYNCVLRGDVSYINIGERSNIQDGTIIHVDRHDIPTIIGDGVTVGHKCLLHACTLKSNCFVGMGSTVMDRAIIEEYAMVAAGSLVTPGKIVRSGEIWAGTPAKLFRKMTDEEIEYISVSADNYVQLMQEYLSNNSF